MFFIIITVLYTAVQLYLLLKSRGFIRDILPDRWKKPASVFLVLFFLWVNAVPLSVLILDMGFWRNPLWQVYVFVYPFFTWMTASLMMAVLFMAKDLLFLAGRGLAKAAGWHTRRSSRDVPDGSKTGTVNPERRAFLKLASAGLAVPPLGISTYGIIFGARNYEKKEITLQFPRLPENLRGLKIVQFTDIHTSDYVTRENVAKAVRMINGEKPDLVLLTGDYVPHDARYIYPCIDALKEVRGKYGVFATIGNHEEWTDPELITGTLVKNGIPVFRNAGTVLTIRDEQINLLGVDDSRWGHADLQRALNMVSPGNFTILMSHQPPFWDMAKTRGIDLTLSGHTHGGQIGINLIGGKFMIGEIFNKYNEGLFETENSKLYVSTGFGFTGPPIRFNIPPEIVVFTLT